jgi:hypothetical protein
VCLARTAGSNYQARAKAEPDSCAFSKLATCSANPVKDVADTEKDDMQKNKKYCLLPYLGFLIIRLKSFDTLSRLRKLPGTNNNNNNIIINNNNKVFL